MSESISMVVDGMNVEGEIVHRSGSDLEVRITSPYQGISRGMHIPYFARADPARDYRGPHGDGTALGLLKSLFLLGKFLEEDMCILKTRLVEMDAAIASLDQERFSRESVFREVRRDLRARLLSGSLDNKVYQQLLVQAKKKVETHRDEIWRLGGDFFEWNFPMIVPVGTRDDVLAILRSSV